jgi:hypothetical protein
MALNSENPDQAIIDALLEDGDDAMVVIWHEIQENDMMVCGIKNHISVMSQRKGAAEARIEKLRSAMLFFLQRTNQKKFKHALFTASIKETASSLVVDDESQIPPRFFKRPDPILDKKELKDCLSQGEVVEGAHLDEGKYTIQLRSN